MPSATDSAAHIGDFDTSIPTVGTTTVSQLDDFIRHVKSVLKTDFAAVTGAVTSSHTELNILDGATLSTAELNVLDGIPGTLTATELGYVDGVTSAIQTQLNAKAALASPTLTGTPLAPTATQGTDTTQIATTAFVNAEIAADVKGSWVLLDTDSTGTGATFDIINGTGGAVMNGTYDVYEIELLAVKPGTDSVDLNLRVTTDAGSTWEAGAGAYVYASLVAQTDSGTAGVTKSTGATSLQLSATFYAIGNTGREHGVYGRILIYKPATATAVRILWDLTYQGYGAQQHRVCGAGAHDVDQDVDGVRLFFSSGNFASGTINLYGRRK